MRIHLLEHEPFFQPTNIDLWAEEKGFTITRSDICHEEPFPDLEEFDWLVAMGAVQHAWEDDVYPWLRKEKTFIARAIEGGKTILGICFGAQLIAEALGGGVFPNHDHEIGWHAVHLTEEGRASEIFGGLPESFQTFHWHSDHFSLPGCCTRMAQSEVSENQAYVAEGGRVVGMQFHPEYTLDLIRHFTIKYGHGWPPGEFVGNRDEVLAKADEYPDTYGLMKIILDGMLKVAARGRA